MAYVIEKPVLNDVLAPLWADSRTGTRHAFLVPDGSELAGQAVAACKTRVTLAVLADGEILRTRWCKKCTALFEDRKTKAHTGLSERTVDAVHTGAQQGAPRDAERKVASQVEAIGKGEAPVPHGRSAAQMPDRPGVGTSVSARTSGQRGEARMDGVALVPGGVNVPPVQPMWRNPKTKQLEVSSRGTMAGGMGQERPDTSIVGRRDKGRFTKSQRKNWRRKQAALTTKAAVADLQERVSRLEGR